MIDDDDDTDEYPELPAGYDDSEPGTIPELFARKLDGAGVLGDVLLPKAPVEPPKAPGATPA